MNNLSAPVLNMLRKRLNRNVKEVKKEMRTNSGNIVAFNCSMYCTGVPVDILNNSTETTETACSDPNEIRVWYRPKIGSEQYSYRKPVAIWMVILSVKYLLGCDTVQFGR